MRYGRHIRQHAFLRNWWYRIPPDTSGSLADWFIDMMNMLLVA